jgi:3D (Asp-Asp-Asp) domain-containing protein
MKAEVYATCSIAAVIAWGICHHHRDQGVLGLVTALVGIFWAFVFGALIGVAIASAHRYSVESTAYSYCSAGTTMANGRHVHWGATANNFLPLGTKIRLDRAITAHRPDGRLVHRHYFKVEDRIGAWSQLDIWMPQCGDAFTWGRRTVSFKVVTR